MSQNKPRVFSREFKIKIIERMVAGESTSALAKEFNIRRKLLYQWKDAYICSGPGALRKRGRPRKADMLGPAPDPIDERAELLQARKRIAELERLVGRQELEKDFFVKALRRLEEVQREESSGARSFTKSLGTKSRKAD
jgi:transposase